MKDTKFDGKGNQGCPAVYVVLVKRWPGFRVTRWSVSRPVMSNGVRGRPTGRSTVGASGSAAVTIGGPRVHDMSGDLPNRASSAAILA
jgi:hypothetical protein